MENGGVVGWIEEDLSDCLTGRDLIAGFDIDLAQVAVDREVITVTDDDGVVEPGDGEYTGNHTVEDGTGFGSRRSQDIDSVIIGTYMLEGGMLMLTEGSDDTV